MQLNFFNFKFKIINFIKFTYFIFNRDDNLLFVIIALRAIARALIGGCIFIYSGSAGLVSFEIKSISKEASRAEPEYMNIHPPISVLATALIALTIVKQ